MLSVCASTRQRSQHVMPPPPPVPPKETADTARSKKRGEGKEERGGVLLVKSSPPVRCRAAAPSPANLHAPPAAPSPLRAPSPTSAPSAAPRRPPLSASIRIGSGGWEVGIETGPERGGRRPNRACFQTGPGRPKRTTIPAQVCFQTGLLYSGRIQASSGPIRALPNEALVFPVTTVTTSSELQYYVLALAFN